MHGVSEPFPWTPEDFIVRVLPLGLLRGESVAIACDVCGEPALRMSYGFSLKYRLLDVAEGGWCELCDEYVIPDVDALGLDWDAMGLEWMGPPDGADPTEDPADGPF